MPVINDCYNHQANKVLNGGHTPETHFITESYTAPEFFLTTLFIPIDAAAAVPATASPPTIRPTQPAGVATINSPNPALTAMEPATALAAKLLDSINISRSQLPPA